MKLLCLFLFVPEPALSKVEGCLGGELVLHRTQSSRASSIPAAEAGSNAFVVSTSAHTSCRLVAAASAASIMLEDPEEAGPQISERHPRGSPPARASISATPVETISGRRRT